MFPPGDNGPVTSATLSNPRAVTIDGSGNIFVLDGDQVRKIDAITGIISTIAGNPLESRGQRKVTRPMMFNWQMPPGRRRSLG